MANEIKDGAVMAQQIQLVKAHAQLLATERNLSNLVMQHQQQQTALREQQTLFTNLKQQASINGMIYDEGTMELTAKPTETKA